MFTDEILDLAKKATTDPDGDGDGDFRCLQCDNDYSLLEDCEPVQFCNDCVHDIVWKLGNAILKAQDGAKP